MSGNQVLEWFDLDSEIKTGGVKDVCAKFSAMIVRVIQLGVH